MCERDSGILSFYLVLPFRTGSSRASLSDPSILSRSVTVTVVVSSRFTGALTHARPLARAPSLQIVVSEVRPRGLASKWWQFAAGDKGDKGDTVVAQAWYQLPPTSHVPLPPAAPPTTP